MMDRVPVEAPPPENMAPPNPMMPAPSVPASGQPELMVTVIKRPLPPPPTRTSASRSHGMETSAKMSAMGSGARNLNWDRIVLIFCIWCVMVCVASR